jgi:hypothetical protein
LKFNILKYCVAKNMSAEVYENEQGSKLRVIKIQAPKSKK